MRMLRRVGVALAAILLLATSVPVAAQSGDLTTIEREIAELNDRISASRAQRTSVQQEIAFTAERMAVLRAELAEAQARVDAVVASIAEKEAELADLEAQLEALKRQLIETRIGIRETRRTVRDQAVELYMGGTTTFAGLNLEVADVAQAAVGQQYAEKVLGSSEILIDALQILENQEVAQQELIGDRQDRTEAILASLEVQHVELEAERQVVENAKAEVEAELVKQEALLAQVNSAISEFEGEISRLEADAERIKAEIRARQSSGGSNPGILSFPVPGYSIGSGYGYRTHPISGVRKLHTGVDIGAPSGTPIVAAGSGTVILASWYGGYGNAIVIDHGGGLATLYGHQSGFAVGSGARVGEGQVIGYVGSTGYSTGPHLHFETRENGNPVNPLKYL